MENLVIVPRSAVTKFSCVNVYNQKLAKAATNRNNKYEGKHKENNSVPHDRPSGVGRQPACLHVERREQRIVLFP